MNMKIPLGTNSQEMKQPGLENGANLFSSFFSSVIRNDWKAQEVRAAVKAVASFCRWAPRVQKRMVTFVTLGHHFLRHVWIFQARLELRDMFWKIAYLPPYRYVVFCRFARHWQSAAE